MNGILCDATTLIVTFCRRIAFHCHILNTLKVKNQTVENTLELCGRQVHGLVVVKERLRRIGYVAEGTNQIEIHQIAQGRYLSLCGIKLTLRVVRIFLSHLWRIVEHRVTAVDDVIEFAPRCEDVACIDILLKDIREVDFLFNIGSTDDVV